MLPCANCYTCVGSLLSSALLKEITQMPRRKRLQGGNAFEQVRRQARSLVVALRGEIRVKETELKRLKEEAAALIRLGGNAGNGKEKPQMRDERPERASKGGRRVDWGTILQQLPKQFKAADVRTVGSVKNKRPSEIFAAITRWIEAGSVKRKTRGVYERS
jgi:hypothetical protein